MSIENFEATSTPPSAAMKCWPAISGKAKLLTLKKGKLFFYDFDDNVDKSKPALILIHGLGDEADSWRHLAPLLAKNGYRVIALDLPGFGRSAWKGSMDIRSHARAVLALIQETNIASAENPAVLIGSSMGAVVAQTAAATRPALAKALILIGGCFPMSGKLGKGFFLLGLPFVGSRYYRGFRKNHEGAWKSLYPYYKDLDAMPAEDKEFLRERVIARVHSCMQERAYFASLRSTIHVSLFGKFSLTKKVKTFPGKMSFIQGEADNVFPLEKTAAFRALRPDADFHQIAGAGHLPHQEKPEETAKVILQILQK